MKKYSILVLVLVLTAALFTGCGCTNQDPGRNTVPTTMPTVATTETTRATSAPTTERTEPSTEATIDHGNGPLDNNGTNGSTENTVEGRARQNVPNVG
ncbi:MAG: hypothetical protein ACI3V5_11845 [Faecousia sp.]